MKVALRLVLVALACGLSSLSIAQVLHPPPVKLRVILFNGIPDAASDHFASLARRITSEFEKLHPDIQLELRPLFIENDDFNLYEPSPAVKNGVASLLSMPSKDGGFDMAEIDTVILGELIENKIVRPWTLSISTDDWQPVGKRAVTVDQDIFGIPHWLCGHFIFSRSKKIAFARTNAALLRALDDSQGGSPKLAGRLTGSWNVPSLYLDAYADTYGTQNLGQAVSLNLNPTVIAYLQKFAKECQLGTDNPCTSDKYNNADVPTGVFAEGKALALFGYSERLNLVRQKAPKDTFFLSSAPIGEGDHPILFTDAFVIRKDCDASCERAGRAFAEYMNLPKTQEWILMGRDKANDAIPRYLIPATLSAFQTPLVRNDRYYRRIRSEIQNADAFPSFGLSNIHTQMRNLIRDQLPKSQ
jgi:thiamine pyridinylase